MIDNCSGLRVEQDEADALTESYPASSSSKAYQVWRTDHENLPGRGLWTSGQFELTLDPARPVDNALRCPPHEPLPT